MPKKKEPTGTPVTKEPTKPTKAEKSAAAVKPTAAPAKPAAAKPAAETAAKAAEKPAAPAPAPAKAAEKPAAPVSAKAEKPAAAPVKDAEKPAAAKAPKKPAASAKATAPVTIVVAKYDVGHGNSMFIRGDGPGLSWETGTAMENAGNDVWVWTTNAASEGVVSFKFLINDESWATGENLTAQTGETTTYYPSF